MRKHVLTAIAAAGTLLTVSGAAKARENQLAGIKLGAPSSLVLEKFGDPSRFSPIYNLFRPPEQSAAGGSEGGSSSGGGEAAAGSDNAGGFLQLLGFTGGGMAAAGTAGEGSGSGGGMMMGSGSGMMMGGGSTSGEGGPLAPAGVAKPAQKYDGRIAGARPEVFASWVLIPAKPRTITLMSIAAASASMGGAMPSGGGESGGMMMSGGEGTSMGGSEGGPMMGAAVSASMQAAMKAGMGGTGGGAGGGGGESGGTGGGTGEEQPIANAWVFEKPHEGMTYIFLVDGGRVSLIAAGDDTPYSIVRGGKKPIGAREPIVTSKEIDGEQIGLGTSFDKIIQAFGWPESTEVLGDEIMLRYFGRQGVAFTLRQNVMRVTSIVVKVPGE